jgi:hypothetical protein
MTQANSSERRAGNANCDVGTDHKAQETNEK